jgi:TolA-binding protein
VASADDQAFARAHTLHFHGADPAAALAAWDDYLRAFPSGRFAPEARYNRAIDLLKLGRNGEARDALQPFADGAFGSYRRDEARAILGSALTATPAGSR